MPIRSNARSVPECQPMRPRRLRRPGAPCAGVPPSERWKGQKQVSYLGSDKRRHGFAMTSVSRWCARTTGSEAVRLLPFCQHSVAPDTHTTTILQLVVDSLRVSRCPAATTGNVCHHDIAKKYLRHRHNARQGRGWPTLGPTLGRPQSCARRISRGWSEETAHSATASEHRVKVQGKGRAGRIGD